MFICIGDEIHMSAFPFILSPLLSEALIYFLAFQIDYSEPYRRENMILETQRPSPKQNQRAGKEKATVPSITHL